MNSPIVTINILLRNSVSIFLAISLLVALSSALASTQRHVESGQITVDDVNLTAQHFFKSFMNDAPDERKNAELYLLGVMDATEGKSWCDYRTFKTITLRERIFEAFKKLDSGQFNERASKVIENILSQRYPCGRKK